MAEIKLEIKEEQRKLYERLLGIVHCDKCIHNVGIRDNTDFYEEDIVCDYWDCDGLCSWDYCSYGKRKEG